MNLCSYCCRNFICGNKITQNYCTGFIKMVDTTWVDKLYQHEENGNKPREWLKEKHHE